MGDNESGGRISVSEDKLKAVLSDFKLELVAEFDKFATKAALEMLDARVKLLELWQAGVIGERRERAGLSERALSLIALLVATMGALAYWLFR